MGFWGWLRRKKNKFSDLITILRGKVSALLFLIGLYMVCWSLHKKTGVSEMHGHYSEVAKIHITEYSSQ